MIAVNESINIRGRMMKNIDDNYHLTTRYGVISLIAVAITALCIFLFYRYQTVQVIDDASRRSNEVLSIATEYALNDHFIMFLNFTGQNNIIGSNEIALGPTEACT